MGLPVLTLTGRSFAARMAGALLTAAEMPGLVTYSLADYEEEAVRIANAPDELLRLKAHLHEVHDHGVLFDTTRFVKNLEARLLELAARL